MLGGRGCLLHLSLVGGNAGEVLETFFGIAMHALTVASPVREWRIMHCMAVVMARAGVSCFSTHARRRGCLLHLSLVGGNAGEVLETFFLGLPCMDGGFACT